MVILLTSSLSWSSAPSKYLRRKEAYQRPFGYFSVVDSFKIFNSMVKPILCYASHIWGYEYVDTIESIHNKFGKSILYVRKTTNTCMVREECGRLPLCTTYYINCIRYLCNSLTMSLHRHPKQCI